MPKTTYSSTEPTANLAQAPAAGQAPAVNVAAVWTGVAPTDNVSWIIDCIGWSYSSDPTDGSIIISWIDPDSGAVTEKYYITKGGPGVLPFSPGKMFPRNTLVTITLAAGGSGVYGTIYPEVRKE